MTVGQTLKCGFPLEWQCRFHAEAVQGADTLGILSK